MNGKVLRELREAKDLTISAVARQLDLAPSTVSLFENSRRVPKPDIISRYARFFEVSADYLIGLSRDTYSLSSLNKNVTDSLRLCDFLNDIIRLDDTSVEILCRQLEIMDKAADQRTIANEQDRSNLIPPEAAEGRASADSGVCCEKAQDQ